MNLSEMPDPEFNDHLCLIATRATTSDSKAMDFESIGHGLSEKLRGEITAELNIERIEILHDFHDTLVEAIRRREALFSEICRHGALIEMSIHKTRETLATVNAQLESSVSTAA